MKNFRTLMTTMPRETTDKEKAAKLLKWMERVQTRIDLDLTEAQKVGVLDPETEQYIRATAILETK